MSYFVDETDVRLICDGVWQASVSPNWNIGENPNGGYLTAIALRAMAELAPHSDPLTVTTHFLRPGIGGIPAEIRAEVIRSGRSITNVRANLVQDGKQRIEVLAVFGDLSFVDRSHTPVTIEPPEIPEPEDCVSRSLIRQGVDLPLLERLNIRVPFEQVKAGETGMPVVSGWIRLSDGTEPDICSAILFADAFPPAIFGILGAVGWVPTIELTTHLRRRPKAGWVLGRFETDDLCDGRMVESGALWDQSGQLIVQTRQLGLLMD